MSLIYLIGFMGVGKSTIGKKLAEKLRYDFFDLDDLFESRYKISIKAFFDKYGEKLFRKLENKLLIETFTFKNSIIATGGGTPCFYNSIDDINRHGISIYLHLPTAAIVKRLNSAIRPRPFVVGKEYDDLVMDVETLLHERETVYKKALLEYDATKPDIQDIISLLGNIQQ
jgi:shikimate kinase